MTHDERFLEGVERALASGQRLFPPATVAALAQLSRTSLAREAALTRTVNDLLYELEVHTPAARR